MRLRCLGEFPISMLDRWNRQLIKSFPSSRPYLAPPAVLPMRAASS